MKNKNNKMSSGNKMAIAGGVAALGAGAYYLFGPNAKMHQKKVSVLMVKMKKEVESEIKKVKKVTPSLYYKAVDIVSKNYAKQYKLHEKDIKKLSGKLKSEWKGVNKVAKKTVRGIKKKI